MVALAGTPAIAITLLTPLAVLSGTVRLIVPEFTVTEPGTGGGAEPTDNCVPMIPATPPQLIGGVIETTGNGLTVNNAQLDMLLGVGFQGAQTPVTMQRYPLLVNPTVTGPTLSVAVVAPL
jgi:hypothetical protein